MFNRMKSMILVVVLAVTISCFLFGVEANSIENDIQKYELDNGATLLLLPRDNAPIVSCVSFVNVGSVREKEGITGISHFLEHLAFKGTKTIGTTDYEQEKIALAKCVKIFDEIKEERAKGADQEAEKVEKLNEQLQEAIAEANKYVIDDEFSRLFEMNGGEGLNAATSYEMTFYTVSLPSNKLELWMLMEADRFTKREKWLQLARMLPLIENNFNLCELGPRSTGKSHLYKEISPNSILVSGGQTTVANLFYNMSTKQVGLVGLWDCVAFDEVAGITFKDKDGVQIMKDYMASGSFARGKEEKAASASMAFVGNINQSVDVLLKTSHLFDPFPEAMAYDTAFLDRMHCYIPGWEIPKYRPESFTNDYGFITDYLAEFMREMRKEPFGDVSDKYFRFGNNLNQRDVIAVRKIVSGFTKLLYPNGEFSKEDIEEIITFALEMRRRVKEQLKKIGGMEFYDVNFSYIDNETFEEHYVSVPEQGGGKIIPEGLTNPGNVYTVSQGKSGMIGVYRLETQMLPGNGKFERTGLGSDRDVKEATNTAFNYLKASGNQISGQISTTTKDYIINYQDLNGIGMTKFLTLPTVIALASCALNKPTLSSLAVLGEISISGTILKVEELASVLQVCLDAGAKKVLIPITSAADLGTVPSDLIGAFSLIFYSTPQEAVFKALGVE